MKVIGMGQNDKYLCEVNHTELEKFMDKYYGKMKHLKIGDVINLGEGYDFYSSTKIALQETKTFIEANQKIVDTIMNGFRILGEKIE